MRTRPFRELVAGHWDDPVRRARREQFRAEMGAMMSERENPTRTTPDIDVETEPERRLNPDKLCPAQKGDVTRKIIEVLP